MRGAIAACRGNAARQQQCGDAAAIQQPGQSGNPPPHHRRGNLERHPRRGRRLRLRRRHRRHHHRRRPGAQAAKEIACSVVAVEPEDSAVLSGKPPGPHKIQGIGAGFIPEILDRSVIDEVIAVSNQDGFRLPPACSPSMTASPAAFLPAPRWPRRCKIGQRPEMAGKNIVVIIPSFAERYLSTALFERLITTFARSRSGLFRRDSPWG